MSEIYIENGGNKCPVCQSENIGISSNFESDGTEIWVPVSCSNCGSDWTEYYRLVAIDNINTLQEVEIWEKEE